jgi:hypothetical protein
MPYRDPYTETELVRVLNAVFAAGTTPYSLKLRPERRT